MSSIESNVMDVGLGIFEGGRGLDLYVCIPILVVSWYVEPSL